MNKQKGEDLVEEILELGGSLAVYDGRGMLIACFSAALGRRVLRTQVARYVDHPTQRVGRIAAAPGEALLDLRLRGN